MSYNRYIDDWNYENDPRNCSSEWKRFNQEEMTLTVDLYIEDDELEVDFPCEFVVCHLCSGKGSHVNPNIDAGGLTRDDFYEMGPDFEENYFAGVYDISCNACEGKRVVPEISESKMDEETKELYQKWLEAEDDRAYYEAECRAERRMGA